MFKKVFGTGLFLFQAGIVWASEKAAATAVAQAQNIAPAHASYLIWTVVVAGISLAIAAGLCGIGQGIAVSRAVEGISRQPEATSQIQQALIIGLAFIESLVLYSLFIGIVLLFVNPFMKYFIE